MPKLADLRARLRSSAQFRQWTIAAGAALATVVWMASGLVTDSESALENAAAVDSIADEEPFAVSVVARSAESIELAVVAQGETRPHRSALLRAQTAGQVAQVLVQPGRTVDEGEPLVRLAPGDRPARLKEAQARVSQRKLELEAAERLSASGYQSRVQVEQARAALEEAQAELAQIREDIAYTTIDAPWGGTIDQVPVDAGDYVGVNGEVLSLVDNDPLSVVTHVPQGRAHDLAAGQPAAVMLISGETRTGHVVAVAPRSDAATRTFRVEIEIPNPDRRPAGTSAEVRIVIGRVMAHRLSPALLALDTEGRLGVKTVAEDERVAFHPVEIVQTGPDGAWVTGLPERVRLITRGAGFVGAGARVRAIDPAAVSPSRAGSANVSG